jgi:energy-coupling factor transport system substrate-specific component
VKLSSLHIAVIGMLIALNVAIGGIVHLIKVPVFLDAIGTIIAVMLLGWRSGILVGVLSFVVSAALVNPVYIWFIGTQAILAIAVFVMANTFAAFRSWLRAIPAGILLGIVTGVVSAPVIVYVFGGVAGSGRDLITATLISTGEQIGKAVLLSGAASEPVDKVLQMVIALLILRALPRRVLEPFNNPLLQKNGLI